MRIITEKFLFEMMEAYPQAASALEGFRRVVRNAKWMNLVELQQFFPHADIVTVKSKRSAFVINICGNKFRLIIAIHFNTQKVFTLDFLTHAEYSKNEWKNRL